MSKHGKRDLTVQLGPLGLHVIIDRPGGPRKRYRLTNSRIPIIRELLENILRTDAYDWEFDFDRLYFDIMVYGV